MASRDTRIALPIAVARCGRSRLIAAMTSVLSVVGDCTIEASPEKDTTPIFTLSLCLSTNARAAAFAASIRFGFMSSASIDPETSIARMTVPSWLGTATTA